MEILKFKQEIMSDEFVKNHVLGLLDKNGKPLDTVIHTFSGVDKGDPHDHPYSFQNTILSGWYVEEIYIPDCPKIKGIKKRRKGDMFLITHNHIHKIIDMSPGGCNTIILPEQKIQESGFWKFENGKAYRRQWNETEFKIYNI